MSQQPAVVAPSPPPVPSNVVTTDAAALMEVITRAASDPNTDVDKLERLMGLYERITDKRAKQSFNDAMKQAQEEMRPVSQDSPNPQTKSKYASYGALDQALRPIYTRHGFSLSFGTGVSDKPDHVRVVCKVGHSAGHEEFPYLDLPADGKGAKGGEVMTRIHATMSAVTYGRRGLLKMIFNIAEGKQWDDDGNTASGTISAEQIEELNRIGKAANASMTAFLRFMNVENIEHIPAAQFQKAKHALEQKKRKGGAK